MRSSDLADNIAGDATGVDAKKGTRRRAARAAAHIARLLSRASGSFTASAALPALEGLADTLGAALARALTVETSVMMKSRGLQVRAQVRMLAAVQLS